MSAHAARRPKAAAKAPAAPVALHPMSAKAVRDRVTGWLPAGTSIEPAAFGDAFDMLAPRDRAALKRARAALLAVLREPSPRLDPGMARDLAWMNLAGYQHECFAAIYMDARQCVVAFEELFHGTVAHTSVHPREIARRALAVGAVAVILAHNHPSGDPSPSTADEALTRHLQRALALVDVRVIDHLVVGRSGCFSFVENGLL